MALEIVIAPNKILTRPCRRVEKREQAEVARLFEQMRETMQDIGVGLAAPQVGKPIRFFIAMDPDSEEVFGYLNPQIMGASRETSIAKEGCLSIPGQVANVERHLAIMLKYQDMDFVEHEKRFDGFYARILQHELDHLNGVLLFDRAVHGMLPEADEPEEVGDNGEPTPAEMRRRKRREKLQSMQVHMQPGQGANEPPVKSNEPPQGSEA